jgi:tetratricopeptide (TPR) repeat protein
MSDCISAERFQSWLAEQLSPGERAAVETHLDACGHCQTTLARLLDEPDGFTGPVAAPPPETPVDFLRRLKATPPLLDALLSAEPAGSAPLPIAFPEPPTPLGPLGRLECYHVVAELGRGAFGFVFKAYDEKLDCLVALKVLRPELAATAEDRASFEEEARKAAAVRHDHVVTIHRVGVTPGFALPYFVMEYLDEALASRLQRQEPLPPAEAAETVRQVALGLAAAHGRGLIHRDLKPSNIMLDRGTGRAKLTDFGLAKRVEGEAGRSRSGAIKGTPCYMAPEQAGGGRVGPAADVYAAGAVLYEMLTGRPPFLGASVPDTLHQVMFDEPVPPRRLQPKLPRDLETICLTCLQKDPAKRYSGAEALAEDLRRFLGGEPIHARPAGVLDRGLKWAKRRPATAALVGVLGLATAVLLTMWLWFTFELHAQRDAVIQERNEANTQRVKAQAAARQARRAVNDYSLKVSQDTRLRAEEFQPLRKELLLGVVSFYEEFVTDNADDPTLRDELYDAYLRLGRIRQEFGDRAEAITSYERSRDLLTDLMRDHPATIYQSDLALLLGNLGILYFFSGEIQKAEQTLRSAESIRQELVHAHPDVPSYQFDLAGTDINLGNLFRSTGRVDDAEQAFGKAQGFLGSLAEKYPKDSRYQNNLAMTHNNLGNLFKGRRQFDRALQAYETAITIGRQLAGKFPRVGSYQGDLADWLVNLALLRQHELANVPEAERTFEEARDILKHLVEEYPTKARYRQSLATTYSNLGSLYLAIPRIAEAEAALREALTLRQSLWERDRNNIKYRGELAVSRHNLGVVYQKTGRIEEAEQSYRQAVQIKLDLARQNPQLAELAISLAFSYGSLGDLLHTRACKPKEAIACFSEAIAWRQKVLLREPQPDQAKTFLSRMYWHRAEARSKLGEFAASFTDLDRAEELHAGPDRVGIRSGRAYVLARQGDHVRAVAEAESLADDKPRLGDDSYRLACVYALSAAALVEDAQLSPADRDRLAARYAVRAIEWLRLAQTVNYFNEPTMMEYLKNDSDLNSLRSRKDFQRLLNEFNACAVP